MRFDPFADRQDAGQALAQELRKRGYSGRDDVVVLGLPRGGVPVAYEVARALQAPLDVFVVRKLGAPGQHELAMGAIATGGVRVLNEGIVRAMGISDELIDRSVSAELEELERREALYRGSRPAVDVAGKTAILVDDGLATGASMRAAVTALRQRKPARIVVAVPVAAADTCREFRDERQVDEMVCLMAPVFFRAVGEWYEEFDQTTDAEVRELLARSSAAGIHPEPSSSQPKHEGQ